MMVQPTIVRNGIGYTLIRLQCRQPCKYKKYCHNGMVKSLREADTELHSEGGGGGGGGGGEG